MSDDVAMTTSRLSVQPGFGIFRRAAGGTQTVWVFNLLSERKQAAVSDGIMGGWGGGGGAVGEGEECGAGLQSQASAKPQSTDMGNEIGGGCYYFFFLVFCYHPNPAMANYKDMRGTNRQINT